MPKPNGSTLSALRQIRDSAEAEAERLDPRRRSFAQIHDEQTRQVVRRLDTIVRQATDAINFLYDWGLTNGR